MGYSMGYNMGYFGGSSTPDTVPIVYSRTRTRLIKTDQGYPSLLEQGRMLIKYVNHAER